MPTSETLIWVIGGGGLLGSRLSRVISSYIPRAKLWDPSPVHFSWSDPARLTEELGHAVAKFAGEAHDRAQAWGVLWCAGSGVITSSGTALEPELMAWKRLLDSLGRDLAGLGGCLPGAVFLASSAGGVFGGSDVPTLTEQTQPQPISEYGAHKLRMEEALLHWTDAFPSVSSLIGRISTLYGPGQNLRKTQGIISHLSRCVIYRKPVCIYVPLDTRRDYLFVDDCAHQIAIAFARLMTERPRAILKVFAAEELTSLARVIGVFLHTGKQRPLVVLQQPRVAQPISLKFRSVIWRDLGPLRKTDLATGIQLVHEFQFGLFRRGLLPPPA